jgi:hypothetical protein
VYKIAPSNTHEGQATWTNVGDKRLLSPGFKSAFVEIASAQIANRWNYMNYEEPVGIIS